VTLQRSPRRERRNAVGPTIRLDLVHNPFGPCPAVIEAIETWLESPPGSLAATFRRRLGEIYHVPAESIHLLSSVDAGIRHVVNRHTGPLVVFPPSAPASFVAERAPVCDPVTIARGPALDAGIGPEFTADLPDHGLAIVDSPSNPLGSILSAADLIRLSRACACVVVDERFAEYSAFSLLPLTRELDNVVVMRSFEPWSGLGEVSCAWAVASPRLANSLGFSREAVSPVAIAGGMATLQNHASVAATLTLIREERSRLYRFLRKLSYLEPLPSWAPFLTARVAISSRQDLITGLARRGIRVYAPPEPGLEQFVRIGIASRTAMDGLRAALLELGPELVC
jgi:histidinol-phosphate aminotransferase